MRVQFLDNDLYNFTMSQFAWKYCRDVEVEYKFINRSNVDIKQYLINFDFAYNLCSMADGEYLRGLDLFEEDYILALESSLLQIELLPSSEDSFSLSYRGPWWKACLYETPFLSAINEELFKARCDLGFAKDKLYKKIEALKTHPYLNFFEFGTRRRAALDWQRIVIAELIESRPKQIHGTSNVMLAKEFGIPAKGTMGHQLFMVEAAIQGHNPNLSQDLVMTKWNELYGRVPGMTTYLVDTFGTDFFLHNFNSAYPHRGFRQDSGDPFVVGEKILDFWNKHYVDPHRKLLVFSDGLDVQTMADLWGQFGTQTNVFFGWGTNLTNDLWNVKPLSLVIKPTRARADKNSEWMDCVKLSDNIAKACGNPDTVERYKELCGYTSQFNQKAVY